MGDESSRRAAVALMAILALLAAGWVYGAVTDWESIATRPTRLAYIICDFGLVIPAGYAAAIGVLRGTRWAPGLFAFALGALAFDIAHGVVYLRWDNYFGVPWAATLLLLVATLGFAWYGLRAVTLSSSGDPEFPSRGTGHHA